MRNDDTSMSALYMGQMCFAPVGQDIHGRPVPSTAGASPSAHVDVVLSQLDVTVTPVPEIQTWVSAGTAFVDDRVEVYDRSLRWVSAEVRAALPLDRTYATVRYSDMGTTDARTGYSLGGGFLTDGRGAFGYDIHRVERLAVGLGWRVNPRVVAKAEVGRDRFTLLTDSPSMRTRTASASPRSRSSCPSSSRFRGGFVPAPRRARLSAPPPGC